MLKRLSPERERKYVKCNGWCRPRYETNQLIGTRKGSVFVRGFSRPRAQAKFERLAVRASLNVDREKPPSSSRGKRNVACCIAQPKKLRSS